MNKKLNIGLFGFGCVGQGLYEVLKQTSGLNAEIKAIVVKNTNKKRSLPEEEFSYDKTIILNDPEINTVVELIDDSDAAFEIVKEALSKGKAVVSANKKMIAEHFEALIGLQNRYQAPFLYEAAVCASIPVIRNLEEYYDNDLLRSLEGIVNGSTNYILSKTFSERISYAEALKQAQEHGYAESNPVLDTGGFDARNKLQILIVHAFGLLIRPEEIFHLGIDRIGALELRYAREKNLKIKLKARAYKNESGKLCAFVMPEAVAATDAFYDVDEVYNALQIEGCFADRQFFRGKGAGAYPTASAVLSDISALRYSYRYEYKKRLGECFQETASNILIRILLSYSPEDAPSVFESFLQVEERYQGNEGAYVVGRISLEALKTCLQGKRYSALLLSNPDGPVSQELLAATEEVGLSL